MYANFTEETCTGTGDTLTPTGATTDNLAFSLSYADGDLVAYALNDSGGSIKITGVGTYNSGANTITRNDTYNYNGTVVDKNPSTNITLSGGTHTVRCDAVAKSFDQAVGTSRRGTRISGHFDADGGTLSFTTVANRIYYIPFLNNSGSPMLLSSLAMNINTAGSASAKMILGNATAFNGEPKNLLFQTPQIDVSSSGNKTGAITAKIPTGWSLMLLITNEAIVVDATDRYSMVGQNPIMGTQFTGSAYFSRVLSFASTTFGTLSDPLPTSTGDADLSTIPTIGVRE
jgi:hypothetical protein